MKKFLIQSAFGFEASLHPLLNFDRVNQAQYYSIITACMERGPRRSMASGVCRASPLRRLHSCKDGTPMLIESGNTLWNRTVQTVNSFILAYWRPHLD